MRQSSWRAPSKIRFGSPARRRTPREGTGPSTVQLEAEGAPPNPSSGFSALHQSQHQLGDDDQENRKLEQLGSIGLCLGVQHLVSLSENRQLALDATAPRGSAKQIQGGRVDPREINIVSNLQRVLSALHSLGDIRNSGLQLTQYRLESPSRNTVSPACSGDAVVHRWQLRVEQRVIHA